MGRDIFWRSFVEEGFTKLEGATDWWDKVNESQRWQDGIFYTLCAAYALVAVVALVFVVLLLELPGLLFFSTYTLLVLFWAEIYYQARSLPTDKLRPAYAIINGLVYVIQVGFVTAICFTCFLIRCFVVALSAFDKNADLDVLDHPILNFIYYMLVEILPSALVLFILRKLPPKRMSDQYHPIR